MSCHKATLPGGRVTLETLPHSDPPFGRVGRQPGEGLGVAAGYKVGGSFKLKPSPLVPRDPPRGRVTSTACYEAKLIARG